jgi:hypothetical protein
MDRGKRVKQPETLGAIQQRTRKSVKLLDDATRTINKPGIIPVKISQELENLRHLVVDKLSRK